MDVNNRISRIEAELSIIKDILNSDGFLTRVRKRIYKTKAEKYKLMESKFIEMINRGLVIEFDTVNQLVKYNSSSHILVVFCIDPKIKTIYFSYYTFISVFEIKFNLKSKQIYPFLLDMMSKHFDLVGYKIEHCYSLSDKNYNINIF